MPQALSTDELLRKYGAGTPEPAAEPEKQEGFNAQRFFDNFSMGQAVAPNPDTTTGVDAAALGFSHGALAGGPDEILQVIAGDSAANTYRESLRKSREDYPWITGGSEVVGSILPFILTGGGSGVVSAANVIRGVAPKVVPSIMRRIFSGSVQGAGRGVGYGALAADPGDRAGGALFGGGVGAVLGGSIPPVAAAIGAGGKKLAQWRARRQTGLTPAAHGPARDVLEADLPEAAKNIAAAGDQAMIADAGVASSGLLDATAAGSPAAGARVRAATSGRVATSTDRISGAIDDTLGTPQSMSAKLGEFRNPATRKLYDDAYAEALTDDTLKILRERATPADIRQAALTAKREGFSITNTVTQADGKTREVLNVRAVDYVTRTLRNKAKKRTSDKRSLYIAASDIRKAAYENHPNYRKAVEVATPEQRQTEALGVGRRLFTGTRDDLLREIEGMTPDELVIVRIGARSSIDDDLARVRRAFADPNADVKEATQALRRLSSRDSRDRLQMILPEKQADQLFDVLDEASRTFTLTSRLAENSKTASRISAKQGMDDALESSIDELGRTVSRARFGNLSGLFQSGDPAGARAGQADELIRLLTAPGNMDKIYRIAGSVDPSRTGEAVRRWAEGLLSTTLQGPAQAVTASGQR